MFGFGTFGQLTFGQGLPLGVALVPAPLIVGAPQLGAPTFGQTHVLTASPLVTGGPQFGAPTFGQTHALVPAPLIIGSPQLGTPKMVIIVTCIMEGEVVSEMVGTTPFVAAMGSGSMQVAYAADIELRSL